MAAVPGGQVACFRYLAAASLWKVVKFPKADRGAEICNIDESIAADGAMTAAVLAGIEQPSLLIAKAASLAIRVTRAAGVPLLLNLGGDTPSEVFHAIRCS
jgi:hypothetical protein